MPGVCTSATECRWCREPVTRCQMSQSSLVTKVLTNVTSRNCRECSFSWKIREKMSKVYKVPVSTISRPLVKENREWLDRDKTGRELVLFIKDELRKTWLALNSVDHSSAVTMYICTSLTWYSLFGSVFHRRSPDCRRRNGTRYQDDPDFCWWTWWTPKPGPAMIQS